MTGRDRARIDRLMDTLERMRLDEYVEHLASRRRLVFDNLLYGVCRGLGFTLGFSVLGALLAVMLRSIGGDGGYEDNFPPCYLSGGLMIAAAAALIWAVPGLEMTAQPPVADGLSLAVADVTARISRYLPWAAAAAMAVLGICRMLGKRPWPLFSGIVCLFYMLMLVTNYRLWSADPQLHGYAYQLLAGVLLMLCSFHRTCCDARVIQRRKLLATGLGAAVCCMASLSGEFQWGFYLASGLWAAGSMCHVAVLPPDPEGDEEAVPEEPEATEETE
jgi:hypothetical protein